MFLHMSEILFTGRCLPQCMLGYTPREQTTPQEHTPHPREQCMLEDTGNKWAVRILLEHTLVSEASVNHSVYGWSLDQEGSASKWGVCIRGGGVDPPQSDTMGYGQQAECILVFIHCTKLRSLSSWLFKVRQLERFPTAKRKWPSKSGKHHGYQLGLTGDVQRRFYWHCTLNLQFLFNMYVRSEYYRSIGMDLDTLTWQKIPWWLS